MSASRGYKRYWRLTDTGIERTISHGEVDSSWNRGIGPIDEAANHNRSVTISAVHTGKPKSESQKQRMKAAKVGVKKTAQHVAAMRKTHLEIADRTREIMDIYPFLAYHKAMRVVGLEKKLGRLPILNEVLEVIK